MGSVFDNKKDSDEPSILIVEDDPGIADFLSLGLEQQGFASDVAQDGETGLRKYTELKPALVVLDIMLPGIDGWEVCRRIRSQSDIPIIVLTAKDEMPDKLKGFELGADDYMVKPFGFDEFLARVKAILKRRGFEVDRNELRFEDLWLRNDTREVTRNGKPINLSAREFDLLKLFMINPRRVISK